MADIVTRIDEIYDSFESSFRDKVEIPETLEYIWLKKAIARYQLELDDLPELVNGVGFEEEIPQSVIDTLACYMKQMYQEREVSKVNKRVSIVGKDISIDGSNGSKTAAKNELEYDASKSEYLTAIQKPTAYV